MTVAPILTTTTAAPPEARAMGSPGKDTVMSLDAPMGTPEKGAPPRPEKSSLAGQLHPREELTRSRDPGPLGVAITISQLAGSGAHEVAEALAVLLQSSETPEARPWTLFDRHLMQKVLEDHHLPMALTEFLGEDPHSYLRDAVDDFLGVIPPTWDVIPMLTETVLALVGTGHVILVGWGASFITASLPQVFHVHLIASARTRAQRMQIRQALTETEATRDVAKADSSRDSFVAAHFGSPLEESLSYHLIINTDRISCEECAVLIAVEAEAFWRRQAEGAA
jgi:hypothetical protein